MKRMPTVVVTGMKSLTGEARGPCDTALVDAACEAGADCVVPKGELSLAFLRVAVRLAFVEHKVQEMAKVAGVL
jgi:hypothetical protein